MTLFKDYLESIENPKIQEHLASIIQWIETEYPMLTPVMKWNQPMYTHHGTFIIGFSKAKGHLNIATEEPSMSVFEHKIKTNNYTLKKMLFQIKAAQSVDFSLLKAMLDFTLEDKKDINTFWK